MASPLFNLVALPKRGRLFPLPQLKGYRPRPKSCVGRGCGPQPFVPSASLTPKEYGPTQKGRTYLTTTNPIWRLRAIYRLAFAKARCKMSVPIWHMHTFFVFVFLSVWFLVLFFSLPFFFLSNFFMFLNFYCFHNIQWTFSSIRWRFFQYIVNIYFKYGVHFSNIWWRIFLLYRLNIFLIYNELFSIIRWIFI